MDIAKQIIDQRVNKILKDNEAVFADTKDAERKRSKAFLLLGVAAYLDIDIPEAAQYITDGGSDGGFDAAYIEVSQDSQLQVFLFQSKYSRDLENDKNFPANSVEKAVNTVKCVFDPKAAIQLNTKSEKSVKEIQSYILDGYIPYVKFVMLNNGLEWNQDGQHHIDNAFRGQSQVEFEHFNHEKIINYINRTKDINTHLSLTGMAIREDFNYKSVILGRVSVLEISSLMEQYGDSLLEKNIRKYLGNNIVNEKIRETLLDKKNRQNFFFFNNGVTMTCEKFSFNGLQKEDWKVKIEKLQIINGGQTCKTIHQTIKDNPDADFSQVYVLVRLYQVSDGEDILNDITYATNSQNPVDFRDLKSNDNYQKLLERGAKDLGYIYKRKRDNQTNMDAIPSSVAAEAVFAIWGKSPHLAKHKKTEFFDKYYKDIFKDLNAAQMVIAVLIFRYCDNYRKKIDDNPYIMAQRPYSQYFVAYLIGQMLLRKFNLDINELTHVNFAEIKAYFENNKVMLHEKAETALVEILKEYLVEPLDEADGRTIAAAFRRFDIVQHYFLNDEWWNRAISL